MVARSVVKARPKPAPKTERLPTIAVARRTANNIIDAMGNTTHAIDSLYSVVDAVALAELRDTVSLEPRTVSGLLMLVTVVRGQARELAEAVASLDEKGGAA